MIKRMCNELFNLDDGIGTLPPKDLRLQTMHDARHKTKQPLCLLHGKRARRKRKLMQQQRIFDEFRQPRRRAQIGLQPNVHLLVAERGVECDPKHVDGALVSRRQSLILCA